MHMGGVEQAAESARSQATEAEAKRLAERVHKAIIYIPNFLGDNGELLCRVADTRAVMQRVDWGCSLPNSREQKDREKKDR